MTVTHISSTGMPEFIELPRPKKKKKHLEEGQEIFFELPLPGQEKKRVLIRGRIIDNDALKASSKQHARKANKIRKPERVQGCFEKLRKKGCKIPRCLDRLLRWFKMVGHRLERASAVIAKTVGGPIKYLGLILLVAGAIHVFVVLCTTPPAAVIAGGLIVLVTALVTKGAVPVMLAGGALFFFGKSLLKGETPMLHNFLNGFPIISYFMNLVPSTYSPVDPHHQT